jgi:hypothetical protein
MKTTPKQPKRNSLITAILFLIVGISMFFLSIFLDSQIICITGLGFIFWGALFLFITPLRYVESNFLIISTLPAYMTLDRILNHLSPKNEAYNIPPYPKDVFLPEHLSGLKEMVTFIPAELTDGTVEIEDIARSKFMIEKPNGLLVTSPGACILDKIEQKPAADFSKIPFSELDEALPNLLGELCLAKGITVTTNENDIILKITGSLYKNLYSEKYNLKSVYLLGCPLVNAAACAIAKSSGKPTMIKEIKTTPDEKTITISFKIINNRSFEKRQKLIAVYGKASIRKKELIEIINASMNIVDLSFDILLGLQKKRINWELLEAYSKPCEEDLSFTYQTMPIMNLNFFKISSAIKSQNAKATSTEAYNLLKDVFEYFDSLNLDDDLKEGALNYINTKAIILLYYLLNDVILGKTVGDKENKKETNQMGNILQILANAAVFKCNIESLMISIDKTIPETDLETFIDHSRSIFKKEFASFFVVN